MSHEISVAVAYHSRFGHTGRQAEAVARGAAEVPGTTVTLIAVDGITEQDWAVLDAADAIVFGSPTYLGDVSAGFRTFVEQTSGRWAEQAWRDKIAAGFVNSGSMSGDKLNSLQSLTIVAAQHGMTWVSLGLLPGWNRSTASDQDLNRLGFWLGAAAQSNGDQGPEGMHPSDLATAEHLGRRVAEQTRRITAGDALPAVAAG
ncbi:flavodoxin family protein [Streptomyces sp. CB03911]|uniref:flavodoxin family protein n=1 Tax=Streptomycetaceae TaxID=2062 RepID=UPI00093D2E03|nr:flavodoxin family protein [Streptomyces sp. CB03911]OKI21810.1 NADPH-dependent FMN reductase [Streptomyces sp. CB03911]